MGKTLSKFSVPKVHRNGTAVAARMRKAAVFHDRRAERGGARNEQASYFDEWQLDDLDEVG